MENMFLFIAPVLLGVLGIIIGSGRGGFLIAGYNTLDKEEQDKYDKEKYFKFMGKLLGVLAFVQLILPICKIFEIGNFKVITIVVVVVFNVIMIGGIIFMNTKNRFKK